MGTQSTDNSAAQRGQAVRWFGRLQLLRLLGKSDRTMAWRVADPGNGQELMLVLPRVQPGDAAALEHWQQAIRKAARLNHPQLAPVLESGVQDGWPYVAYDVHDRATLAEHVPAKGLAAQQAAAWAVQCVQGLAFAHEAGVAHHDLQPYLLLVGEGGVLSVAGLAVASEQVRSERAAHPGPGTDAGGLQVHREAAERDVLAAGVVLHAMLTGQRPLDETDVGRVVARLPPLGRDILRLPWAIVHPVPEPLRAIVNRATDRQERQRYRNGRTLLNALEGWLRSESSAGGGPLALLGDRLRAAGVLPSLPGAAARAARLAMMERERTSELANVVLEDLALSFELLRLVNSAQVRGAMVSGNGPVLTVRRAIAMLGLDGVRRAALALRAWPGPLDDAGATALQQLADRCKRAGRVALALRPAGYDAEVVYLITLLQNLGRLVVQYHFADEAQQIRRLMQPAPSSREGEPEDPGMEEEGAAFAVLGIDIETIGHAVARHWGLDDSIVAMIRRLPRTTAIRVPEGDDDMLRTLASCANETLDALGLPAPRVAGALQRVVQRYGRALSMSTRDLHQALQPGATGSISTPMTAPAPLAEDPP
jgi:non-specific serine/threonine protein kinase